MRDGVGKRRGRRVASLEWSIVHRVPAVLWERDGQTGRFTYVSDEASRILGLPAKLWIERPDFWREHVHPDDHEAAERSFHADVQRGCGYSIEYRMVAGDGHVVWVRDTMSVVIAHGRPARAYGVMVDVTARKLAEGAQALQEARLRRQNAALLCIAEKETLHLGDLDEALRLITEAAVRAMDVSRASFWTFGGEQMRCLDLYEREGKRHSPGGVIAAASYPTYVAALAGGRALPVEDVRGDPRTRELAEYLEQHDIRSMLDAPVRVGGQVAGVLCLEHTGGTRVWMADEEQFAGALADLIALAMEARKRKAAEIALRVSEAHTRAVLGASRDAIVVVDAGRRVVEFNRAAEAMFGRSRVEMLGEDAVERLVPAALRDRVIETMARLRGDDEMGAQTRIELVGLRADGSEFPVEVTLFTLPDDEGGVSIGGFVRDLTNHAAAAPRGDELPHGVLHLETDLEALVEARTRDVRAAMLEMEAFSYTVSHDLRAPIRAIDAFAQLLSDECGDELGERGARYLQRIRSAARRLAILVNDFMLLARVASTELSRVPVDLTTLGHAVAEELRQGAPERMVTFCVQDGLEARGEPGLVRILLENLIGNAWKFTSHHPTAEISFGAASVGGEEVFTLRDDGAGFDPARADRLFRPFSRLHAAGEFDGTGIGLAIARKIVERHGGRIWAEGAVEAGAAFHFTLGPPRGETGADGNGWGVAEGTGIA